MTRIVKELRDEGIPLQFPTAAATANTVSNAVSSSSTMDLFDFPVGLQHLRVCHRDDIIATAQFLCDAAASD
ncbi:hypothetical protein HK102_001740, partial [Quaeritorhiza haematococci]